MDQDNDPLRPRPTQDARSFFMLPQAPMDSGYYVYGELFRQPAKGAYQYAHPTMMTTILRVGLEWQATERRRFGVGDISLANGVLTPDHHTHRTGLEVDVRPLRKDGREDAVSWWDTAYDNHFHLKLRG
jgi:penicillin-insensitive murein endopeptidase